MIGLTVKGYLAVFTALAFLIAAVLWFQGRARADRRTRYFATYHTAQLRMSRTKIGVVYCVAEHDPNTDAVAAKRIWDDGAAIVDAKAIHISPDALCPFDPDRFA